MTQFIILSVFFLSGISGLVYQVVWVRLFGNVFGNTVYSAAAVTAVFMFGLGAGGYLIGRWADRVFLRDPVRPLRLYGYAELLIGLWCLGVAVLLPEVTGLAGWTSSYVPTEKGWYELSPGSRAALYAAAVVMLAPPTLLMGGTLTLLIRFLVARRLELAGWRIGLLYGINTLGAAAGCFLTDHALVPLLGIFRTELTAVLLNWIAGAGALLVSLKRPSHSPGEFEPRVSRPPLKTPASDPRATRTAAALFLSGFAALGMEIVWFRLLISILGGYRSVFSIVLTVVLLGIWAGALLGGWLHRRWQRPALFFALTQCAFAAGAVILTWSYSGGFLSAHAHAVQSSYQQASSVGRWMMDTWANGRVALFLVGLPALCLGFTFPLGNALVQRSEAEVGRKAGTLYLANTAGNVAGALVAGFVLLTLFGVEMSLSIFASCAVVSALLLYPFAAGEPAGSGPLRARRTLFAFGIGAAAVSIFAFSRLPAGHLVERMFEFSRSGNETVIATHEGVNETLMVTEFRKDGRRLHTNGHRMSSTALFTQRYMRAASHIPLLQLDAPGRVLNIAFGVGNTLHAASLHPVEHLEVVDLSRAILEHARYFSHSNRDILLDPRVRVFVNDGRLHLTMQEPDAYDLITLEPPPINFAGTAALYTREFYELAHSRLRPGGYLTQWLPAHQLPGDASLTLVRAFVEVFPQSVLLGSFRDLILLGVKGDSIEIDIGRVAERLAGRPGVRQDLKAMRMATPTDLVGSFVASSETMRRVSARVPSLVDDRPINEYAARSNLMVNIQARELFDVSGARSWCPTCFSEELLSDALADLPAYLEIMQQVYASRAFLVDAPVHAPPAGIDWQTPERRRAVQRSAWLQVLLDRLR